MLSRERSGEVGVVVKTKRYLITIEGLPSARINDLLVDANGNRAIVRALSDEYVFALALSSSASPGDRYQYYAEESIYACGDHLFGRIIDAFGRPVDNKGSFPPANVPLRLEVEAPGIEVRQPIHDQLYTGITMVDTLIPIAKGQRQLIFGPMRSGKTTFLTETVKAQAGSGMVCIYTVIGKPINGLRKVADTLIAAEEKNGNKVIIISALSDEPAPVIALAPSVAFLIAEYFQARGEHVLVVLDDLDTHAKYLREIALLEGRLPSTESYPGDIFYQHAHLMERSGHFTDAIGGGSITALPVIQTDLKNFSDLIPTNVMACTDGHLAFVPGMRAEGIYPSINLEQSVTRVGRQAQRRLQKQATRHIQILLGSYRSQKEYAKFSADLSEHARGLLRRGRIIEILLKQPEYEGRNLSVQVIALSLAFTDFFDDYSLEDIEVSMPALFDALTHENRFATLRAKVLDDTIEWNIFLTEVKRFQAALVQYVVRS